MSRATGYATIKLNGGGPFYFNFDGTVHEACTSLYWSKDECISNYREPSDHNQCTCPNKGDVTLEVHVAYGNGIDWETQGCIKCMAITGDLNNHIKQPTDTYGFG